MKHKPLHKFTFLILIYIISKLPVFAGGIIDVGVPFILSPADGDVGLAPITISVHNYGDVTVYDIPVHWVADGGAILSEIAAGPVLPGDSIAFTFPTDIDAYPGINMCAWSSLPGDENYYNDSTCGTVVFFAPPIIELGPDTSGCEGYMLDAGNPGMFYLWSTGETTQTKIVNTTDLYWVEVTNEGGVSMSDSIFIDIDPVPVVDFEFTLSGLTANFINLSSDAEFFNWDFGDGFTSSEENPVHIYATADIYNISLQVFNSCASSYTSKTLDFMYSVSDQGNTILSIDPNPATAFLEIEFRDISGTAYTIFGITGNRIRSGEIKSGEKLDISSLEKGIYFIEIISENKSIARERFIKM